ncbi:MAG: EscU/YscU/HrcU family type III secretion system export apparatus switch protein [Nitrospirae bacterium]|nr:EscU/YscU/HrcU family type III secretion system export apparatus switch protein [Candidatus Troglogloeales bacterium]
MGSEDLLQRKAAALKYQHGTDPVPRLVAKGGGHIADKIIALAKEHGVPIHEDKNLIEILSTLDLYEQIPPKLYKAVAEILAFIYKMSGKV